MAGELGWVGSGYTPDLETYDPTWASNTGLVSNWSAGTGDTVNNFGQSSWLDYLNPFGNNFLGGVLGSGSSGTSGFGGLSGLMGLGQLGMGLYNALNAGKQLDMQQEMFDFQKGLANRNLANQAKMVNDAYSRAQQTAAYLAGSTTSNGRATAATSKQRDTARKLAKEQEINGSAIG